jgi:hypothetical protein
MKTGIFIKGVVCQETKSPRYGVFSQALRGEPDRKLL